MQMEVWFMRRKWKEIKQRKREKLTYMEASVAAGETSLIAKRKSKRLKKKQPAWGKKE